MTTFTREQQMEFKARFRLKRRRQIYLAVPLVAWMVAVLVSKVTDRPDVLGVDIEVWAPGMLIVILGALIFSFLNWRCPACDRYLGREINPRFCTECGVELR